MSEHFLLAVIHHLVFSFRSTRICVHVKTMLRFILNDATKRRIQLDASAHETKWPNKIYFAADKVEVADGNVC